MRRSITRCLFSLCLILGAAGFSLFDRRSSYIEFERWRAVADGRIVVSFRCKTYVKTGLLFYVDDQAQGSGEYLTLYLRDGFLVLELSDGKRKVFKARSKVIINDLEWHRIAVELTPRHAVYRLDNRTQAEFSISKMQLESDVFIGGFPNDIDVFSLSHDGVTFEQRFLGCVEDMQFSYKGVNSTESRAAQVLKSSGMDVECKNACRPRNPCRNNGVCINKFAMAECSCSGTGYRGKTCEEESPVVGISSADHRVIFDVPSSFIAFSSEATSMFVRFRTTQADGVFFYTSHKGDYILLELTNGKVAASVNLGSGSVTITTKKDGYNDNQWHRVELKRVKRLVNLTVDTLDTSKGETRGVFDKFHLSKKKSSFVLGGLADDRKTISKSVSRKNFTGCLQELTFNGYDLFWKFNTSAKEIVSRGRILKTCPKTPTKPPKVIATTKIDVLEPTNRNTTVFVTLKTTKASDIFSVTSSPTTNQNLPCILAGIPCDGTTTGMPTSQAHVTSAKQISTDSLSWTTGKSLSTDDQLASTSEIDVETSSKTTPDGSTKTSPNPPSKKIIGGATIRPVPSIKEVTQGDGVYRTTGEVIMASSNERSEGDLTAWFIVAAVVGLVAFILAIAIIVKVNSANRKKYAIKGKKSDRDYWTDTGSFQRNTKPLV